MVVNENGHERRNEIPKDSELLCTSLTLGGGASIWRGIKHLSASRSILLLAFTAQLHAVDVDMTDDSVNIPLPPSPPAASVSLDALLSPKDDVAFDAAAPNRESIAESTTSEDDARFSTVSLNPPTMSTIAETSEGTPTSPTATLAPSLDTFDKTHKKSASTTTIRSNHSLSFVQKHSEDVSNKRASVDGQAKLQEEFARLQKEKEDVVDNRESNGEIIDWGACGTPFDTYRC